MLVFPFAQVLGVSPCEDAKGLSKVMRTGSSWAKAFLKGGEELD